MILYVIFETARNGGLFCVQKNMREITGTGEFFERGSFRLNGKTKNQHCTFSSFPMFYTNMFALLYSYCLLVLKIVQAIPSHY